MGEIFRIIVPEGDESLSDLQDLKQKIPGSTRIKLVIPEGKIPGQEPHHLYIFRIHGSQSDIDYEAK